MAKLVKVAAGGDDVRCNCLNPAFKYLENKLITAENIAKLFARARKVDRSLHGSEPVSIMYTGGTIRPLKDGNVDMVVESIGFHDGKVAAVGSKEEVTTKMDTLGVNYTTAKLFEGQTLLPGMIEPHVHIISTAMILTAWNDFGPFDGQDMRDPYNSTFLEKGIEEAKKSLKEGYWVLAHSVDPSMMPFTIVDDGLNVLQRYDVDTVDKIENEVPVFMLSASGHTGYVNTKALREIYDKVKPPGYDTFDEYREHVNTGGGLQEIEEIIPAFGAIPQRQLLETILSIWNGLNEIFDLAAKRGVTLLYDAAMSSEQKQLLDLYCSISTKKVRIGYGKIVNSLAEANKVETWKPVPDVDEIYQGAIKIVSDGSNQGLTGYQIEPYRCEPPNNTGLFNFSVDEFNEIVKTIVGKGWPLMIHGNGNKAIDQILTAYAEALGGVNGLAKRHRIEHCSLLDDDAIKKMRELGISPSFLIGHVGYWGYAFKKGIFEEKAQILVRTQSALNNGLRITLHTDYFVSPMGPLRMMEQAITRIMEQDSQDRALNEDEKLTPAQALRAITYDAAWQCQADQWVGSLEVGKLADYVILGEDPITRKIPVGMRNIPVLETWVGGIRTGTLSVTPGKFKKS